jgi:hypothetical protein
MDAETVWDRFHSAQDRGKELLGLNGGNLPGADPKLRQRLVQEFFFHLGGSIEFMAQLAGEQRGVATVETISISNIADQVRGDALEAPLRALYVNIRRHRFQVTPNDEGYLSRVYNYRHQVTHRGANPFNFHTRLGDAATSMAEPPPPQNPSTFLVDPLDSARGPSRETIEFEVARGSVKHERRVWAFLAIKQDFLTITTGTAAAKVPRRTGHPPPARC